MSIKFGIFVNLKIDRIFRSNSLVSSRSSIPPDIPDIINEENYSVEEESCLDFNKWTIPKINVNAIYKTSWLNSTFKTEFNVKTIKRAYAISRVHEKCCLFNKKSIHDFLTKGYRFLHIGFVQVAVKPLTRNSVNDSILDTFT